VTLPQPEHRCRPSLRPCQWSNLSDSEADDAHCSPMGGAAISLPSLPTEPFAGWRPMRPQRVRLCCHRPVGRRLPRLGREYTAHHRLWNKNACRRPRGRSDVPARDGRSACDKNKAKVAMRGAVVVRVHGIRCRISSTTRAGRAHWSMPSARC
jgi:hypothetical protein